MPRIVLKQTVIDELNGDPEIQGWLRHKSGRKVTFLGYYRRSDATSHDGAVTEYGELTTIDPHDSGETRAIVINRVAVDRDFGILVGGDEAIMSRDFAIGWSKTFTYEPLA